MSFLDVTRQAVIDAIVEYDQLGRDEFRRKHGVANNDGFFVDQRGRLYDARAVVAVARGIATGSAVEPSLLNAGLVELDRCLRRLGFATTHAAHGVFAGSGSPSGTRSPISRQPRFEVPYRATKFPIGLVPSPSMLAFTADDLAHAMFVTGRAPADRRRYGMTSVFEFQHRVSIIPAYIRRHHTARLARSQLAIELDRSEKTGLSYNIGQAMTALFCQVVLGVGFLLHVDRYALSYGLTFAGRKRSDLFGFDGQGWVVAEAKGRSAGMESDLRAKLEAQKRSVLSICGQTPRIALGCVASFPPKGNGLHLDAFDPEEVQAEAIQIDGDLDRFFYAYYLPFVNAIDAGQAGDGTEKVIEASYPGLGIRIAMLRPIYEFFRETYSRPIEGLAATIFDLLESRALAEVALRPDGTVIRTAWTDDVDPSLD